MATSLGLAELGFSRRDIRRYSANILTYLNRDRIHDFADLDRAIERGVDFKPTNDEVICISSEETGAPKGYLPNTYSISYWINVKGRVLKSIKAEIEKDSLKAQMILDCNEILVGYESDGRISSARNMYQTKTLEARGLVSVVKELIELSLLA